MPWWCQGFCLAYIYIDKHEYWIQIQTQVTLVPFTYMKLIYIYMERDTGKQTEVSNIQRCVRQWWRHELETLSGLLAICEVNPLVTVSFRHRGSIMASFDVFLYVNPNRLLTKHSVCRWIGTLWQLMVSWNHGGACEARYSMKLNSCR